MTEKSLNSIPSVVLLSEIDDQTLVEGLRKTKHLTETEPTNSGWTIEQIGELSLALGKKPSGVKLPTDKSNQ